MSEFYNEVIKSDENIRRQHNQIQEPDNDNGKQFISKIFKHFLERNDMKDNKPIPNSYPQLQGKVEAYNKVVKNEFLSIEDIANSYDGRTRYERCLSNHTTTHKRAYGGINGLTPSEMFLQTFNKSYNSNEAKQKSVTYLCR